ncbi:hypothetical protein DUNSADRAFT_1273 [Dunaliella salina]|uniref:Uncharacterized protein n=1 Tax=Dunaliella salina TaxID=3046 RepID=A0ABQ7GXA6_DUNSA|nr:hypothetical protein DUNSADRAFT_1273 [Dunaliella salina]|eukprot:KAF5839239.1 hypothetical protein DUNSADRAFT_1273 [Dunaliella salina]
MWTAPRVNAQALKTVATTAHSLLSQTAPDAACSINSSSSTGGLRAYAGSAGNGGSGYSMGGGGDHGNGSRRGSRGAGRGDSIVAIAKELRKQCEASAKEALEHQAARMVMADPLAQLMASRGMPLGISWPAASNKAVDGTV